MDKVLKGIAFPIRFRTNLLSRKQTKFDEHLGEKVVVRDRQPRNGIMQLYFAPEPIVAAKRDLLEPGRDTRPAREVYAKHHLYGDHQFLVPVKAAPIEQYEALWDAEVSFDMIAGDPTTAVQHELLQLLPCTSGNLELMLDKVQSQPFYIALDRDYIRLYIKGSRGSYLCVPAQDYAPRCWPAFGHQVMTLQYESGTVPIRRLADIDWPTIADGLGVKWHR